MTESQEIPQQTMQERAYSLLQKVLDIVPIVQEKALMVLGLVLDYAVYLIAAYVLYKAGLRLYAYVMTLWVQADLN